ncbi:MAG: hypothetical protein V1866_01005 [archaeon]
MLDERRVKEAKSSMAAYLADGLIKKNIFKQIIFDTYLRNHRESLRLAAYVHEKKLSCLWTVVISYYSMFYMANAVLYAFGYKVGDSRAHRVTADALICFVREKLRGSLLECYEEAMEEALEMAGARADEIISSFDKERKKRSEFQYETSEDLKESKASTSLHRAEEFAVEMNRLLKSSL